MSKLFNPLDSDNKDDKDLIHNLLEVNPEFKLSRKLSYLKQLKQLKMSENKNFQTHETYFIPELIAKVNYFISKHIILTAFLVAFLFSGVSAFATELVAPNQFKPSTLIQNLSSDKVNILENSDDVEVSTSTPVSTAGSEKISQNFAGTKYSLTEISSGKKFILNPKSNEVGEVLLQKDDFTLCQPSSFDPKTSKYTKISETIDGINYEFYETESLQNQEESLALASSFQINGFIKENEINIILPNPFKINQYIFACGSNFDTVAEVTSAENRHFLFSKVLNQIDQKAFSEDGEFLYLVNLVESGNNFLRKNRIINIETKTEVNLSGNCITDNSSGSWFGNKLITNSSLSVDESVNGDNTQFCIWDSEGNELKYFEYPANWISTSVNNINVLLGLSENYFYIYNRNTNFKANQPCILSVLNIETNTTKEVFVQNSNEFADCPNIKIEGIDAENAYISKIDNAVNETSITSSISSSPN